MAKVATTAKVLSHAVLLLVAVVIFTLGLGIGLQINSAVGSALWVCAALITVVNIGWAVAWISRWRTS